MKRDIYTVFGNEIRNKLIICLSNGPKNVTELIQNCGLAQSAVSQHLAKLRRSGLVITEKNGKEVIYYLTKQHAAQISRMIVSLDHENE